MKVLFLFSGTRIEKAKKVESGEGHDNQFFGMYRIRKHGIETSFFEPDLVLPKRIAKLWRKIFNIFWMDLPFFPKFLKYDMVFSGGAYASLLFKAIFRIKKPKWVIYDMNISGTIGKAMTLRQKIFKFAVSKADGIITISQEEENTLKEMFSHMKDNVQFLYEGVDTKYFAPSDKPESDYILSVGLDPSRDFETLIEAVRGTDIRLKIATKPTRAKKLEPLPPNVTAGFYSPEEMNKIYARARCIVIGLNMKEDNNDSMGTFAVIEAMASGKAVVATKTKALSSYIEHNKTGVFVPVRDVEKMREAILDLYNDKEKRENIGKNGRAFIEEHASADMFAQKLAVFLKKIYEMK